jgi:hypothetical protein
VVRNLETGHRRPTRTQPKSEAAETGIEVEYDWADRTLIQWNDLDDLQKERVIKSADLGKDDQIGALYEQTVDGLWMYFNHLIHSRGLWENIIYNESIKAPIVRYLADLKRLSRSYEALNPLQRFLVHDILDDGDDEDLRISTFMQAARVVSEQSLTPYKPRRKRGGQSKGKELNAFADELVDNWCAVTFREPSWSTSNGRIGAFLVEVLALVKLEVTVRYRDASPRPDVPDAAPDEILNIRIRLQQHHTEIHGAVERAVRERRSKTHPRIKSQ